MPCSAGGPGVPAGGAGDAVGQGVVAGNAGGVDAAAQE